MKFNGRIRLDMFFVTMTLIIGVLIWVYRRPETVFSEAIVMAGLTVCVCLVIALFLAVVGVKLAPKLQEWLWLDKKGMQWRR